MNATNKCEHKFIKIVSAHFVTNENCYADYHWCKKCGTVKAVKTYDESVVNEWTPDDYYILRTRRTQNVKLIEYDLNYDYYDGPDLITKIKEEDGVVCGALSPVPCEDCKEKECYYYAGNMTKEEKDE